MPFTKPLNELTLRELLEGLQSETLQPAAQMVAAVSAAFGLPLALTASPGADVTDRLARLLGVVVSRTEEDRQTRDGEGFRFGTSQVAVAAQNGWVQLFNPAASGKVLLVSRVLAMHNIASGNLFLRTHNASLGGVAETLTTSNRQVGGAAPSAELRVGSQAGVPATNSYGHLTTVEAGRYHDLLNRETMQVPAGQSLVVASGTVNVAVGALYVWREVAA